MGVRSLPHRSPTRFFGLVFALAVPFWVLGAVVKTPEGAPVRLPLSALQLVTPLAAATILAYGEGGSRGVRRLLRRLVDTGRAGSWRNYGLIVVVMPAIYGLGYIVMGASGRALPDPTISVGSIAVLLVLFLVAAAFEEGGWTAYALDPLQNRVGMVRAALGLGLVWAGFHLVADLQGGHELSWIFLHRTSATALRVMMVCAYNATGHGVVAAILLHAIDNVSWQLFPGAGSTYDPAFIAPITVTASVVAIAWTRRALGNADTGSDLDLNPVPRRP